MIEVRCQCGQADRQLTSDRRARERGEDLTTAPHTASCPIVVQQAYDETVRLIAEAEAQTTMFDDDAHARSIVDLKARRDRLGARLDQHTGRS